jgi:hypothetical protein
MINNINTYNTNSTFGLKDINNIKNVYLRKNIKKITNPVEQKNKKQKLIKKTYKTLKYKIPHNYVKNIHEENKNNEYIYSMSNKNNDELLVNSDILLNYIDFNENDNDMNYLEPKKSITNYK